MSTQESAGRSIAEIREKYYLSESFPSINEFDEGVAPSAPTSLDMIGVDPQVLRNLVIKHAATTPTFTTEWAVEQTCLPLQIVEELCWELKQDKLIEILGQNGPFSYKYASTSEGRDLATRIMEISGYLGPAPVSIEHYRQFLKWQVARQPEVSMDEVKQAISHLVLPEEAVEVAALATASGRSLFVFGPPGNGKTSLGRALHAVYGNEMWMPYCICLENNIIRLFDPQVHERLDMETVSPGQIDQRWIRIRRPFVVAGGEMTMDELDLAWSPSLRFYEAPPHLKANGGTFLIDDFGRQRIDPTDLLNRWIIPMEHRIDHLTLATGQKLEVPFLLMLIVATNLTVSDVADPAFLRRMGYRLHMQAPTPENYQQIFRDYAAQFEIPIEDGILPKLLEKYREEGRDLRASEPRDLIERVKDICRLTNRPNQINSETVATAWRGYFGSTGN